MMKKTTNIPGELNMNKSLVLVTGGNGFLASHIIKQLLTAGYPVRATLRSLDKAAGVKQTLAGTPNLDRLTFVALDLTQDQGWAEAMRDVTYVMSVAAPVFVNQGQASDEVTSAAKVGTIRVLKAATAAGVKRVVMTANLGAVGFSRLDHDHPVTEVDWTREDQPGLSLYEKSKLVAEEAGWAYCKAHADSPEFTTVNAGAMLGPSLNGHVTGSYNLVSRILTGQMMPNLKVNVIDVRDVADLEVRAMTAPAAANQRFLAVAATPISMRDLKTLIQEQRPQLAAGLTKHLIPDWFVRGLAPFSGQLRESSLMIRINHEVSTQKAQQLLGWQALSADTAVLAAVDTLVKNGLNK